MLDRIKRFANVEGMAGPAFIMLFATIVGGVCNFLFQITLINDKVPNFSYGELSTLLAILYIVSVPASTVQNMLIRYVSKYKTLDRQDVISWLVRRTLVLVAVVGVIISILVVLVLSVPEVRTTLTLTSTLPIVLLGVGVFVSLLSPIGHGPLQALQRFTAFGALNVSNFLLKLILGVGLVFLGFGVAGAMGGVVIGSAFSTAVSFILVRKYLLSPGTPVESKEIWWFALPATIGILCYTVLYNVDILIANGLLPVKEYKDIYSAASNLAKVILFLPGAVATVMFPKMAKVHTEKGETRNLLMTAFGMTLFLSVMASLAFAIFPDLIVNILIPGASYRGSVADLLPSLGIVMVFIGMANLYVLYGLATDNHAYIAIIALSILVLGTMVGATIATGTAFTGLIMAQIMILTGLFIVVVSTAYLLIFDREWKRRKK